MGEYEEEYPIEFTKSQAKELLITLVQMRNRGEEPPDNLHPFIELAMDLEEICGWRPEDEEENTKPEEEVSPEEMIVRTFTLKHSDWEYLANFVGAEIFLREFQVKAKGTEPEKEELKTLRRIKKGMYNST